MSNEIDVRLVGNYTVELNEQGPPGAPGLGIASISEIGYDIETGEYTYRITYTDDSYYDFVIQGGARYTGSTGIIINNDTISVDTDVIATKNDLLDKQDVIDSSNKLPSDLVDDTGNTNKFATQSQLNQISTNQSDISTINSKISDSASSSNKLIDKNYVDAEDSDLQDQINNLKARGRFLALWNCATGLAETNPPQSPYTYHTGDYFIVGTISDANPQVNYKPSGSSYTTGVVSSTVETNAVDVDDVYYYDGTSWHLQINTQKTTSFVNIAGSPYDNTNLSTALNSKQDTLTFSTGLTDTSGTITVTDYNKLIKNNSPATGSISLIGAGTSSSNAINIGYGSEAKGVNPICIGTTAKTGNVSNAIQLGGGTNDASNTFQVWIYELLNGTTGLIPDARLSNNIARTSAIPTVNNGTITLTQGGVTKGSFTVNQSGDTTIALDAGGSGTISDVQVNGSSVVSNGVANIVTNTAYNSSSNKIATMSDVPAAQIQSDWNQTNTSAVDYIKNKPTLSTVTLKDWSV